MSEELSELEGAVLGCIWSAGSMTAYAVAAQFAKSRSSHFSGSAGAIYPLVSRLAEQGLLEASEHMQGKRRSLSYALSTLGKRALRAWVAPPVPAWMAAVEFDPLRTRVLFLKILSPRQRQRFVEDARQRLVGEIAATEQLIQEHTQEGDEFGAWGARGALGVLRARQEWLAALQQHLTGE